MTGAVAGPWGAGVIDAVIAEIRAALAATTRRPVVLGLCGAQGSGKSTLAAQAAARLQALDLPTAILSLDDLYLTRAERHELARTVHPLFATRGVPGTHDVALGRETIASLEQGAPVPMPRFDKSRDDRVPRADWPCAPAHCAVLLFEGWCVGARPQPVEALAHTVNALEAQEDAEGTWRGHANVALTGPYAQLFARLDRLILLAAPDFAVVEGWRAEQEERAASAASGTGSRLMDRAALARFVAHYERLTRHILADMPGYADRVIRLGPAREVLEIS
ncbi:kinase [Novosphingobium colocasiae]|uniref:Kinase n=1 Tax=Novosphingobium colocasiae TaxID=1256513 RepID=A0A918PE52_9SPHN|nr:kinase [Novosphingobium colocasiae]GGZ01312.1 kinase [Novosphingobium colocasiae]